MIVRPTVIKIPEKFEQHSAFEFASSLAAIRSAPRIEVDFSELRYSRPFGMLLVASELRKIAKKRPPGTMFLSGLSNLNSAHSYLAHIGFFEHVGISYGNKPGEALGNIRYVPITVLDKKELQKNPANFGYPIGYAAQRESDRLALVLTQEKNPAVNRPIAYCLREIIRNTFEHGETDQSVVCAQRWSDSEIELGIVDRGRGIKESLIERMDVKSDIEALQLAIQPGVSRSATAYSDDVWANSGFGLFVLSELGKRHGTFTICSGDSALIAEKGQIHEEQFKFQGTAVRLNFKHPSNINFEAAIKEIVREGESLISVQGAARRASKSSKTL